MSSGTQARAMQNDSQTTWKCASIVVPRFDFEVLRLYRGTTLQTISILFLLTLVLMLAMKFFVTPKYGRDVEGRFLERLQYIPSQTEVLSSATLGRWLADKANAPAIRGYVFPVSDHQLIIWRFVTCHL